MAERVAAKLEHPAEPDRGAGAGAEVRLDTWYRFAYDSPLPHLSSPRASAYSAFDDRFPTRGLLAMVLEPDLPHRSDVLSELMGQPAQNWLGIAAAGVFTIPGTDERRLAVILERPEGGRLWPSILSPAPPISELYISKRIVPALAGALADLEHRHIAHGAIRPDNLFYADAGRHHVALGECFSEPAGLSQPIAFEPIERALATPLARGEGTSACDLYALGVTVLALHTGRDPAAGRDDQELLQSRLVEGSYRALVGDIRISNALGTLLKGLLNDDPAIRWTPEQVAAWCKTPRVIPKPTPRPKRAPRPFSFASKEYAYAQVLAMDLSRNAAEAVKAVRGGKLENWLRRELHDAAAGEMMAHFLTRRKMSDEELITSTCLALDPNGPIRLRDLAVLPGGVGPVLAGAYAANDTDRLQAIAELLAGDLPGLWIEARDRSAPEAVTAMRALAEMQRHVKERATGFGLERCLYQLNPSLPCRSPLLAADFVLSSRDLLVALDKAVARGDGGERLLDRHITAFIASRRPQSSGILHRLARAGDDEAEAKLASLALLADLQRRERGMELPSLSAWMARRLEPVIGTFHSQIRRDVIAEKLEAIAGDGDLAKIQALLDRSGARQRDETEFAAAKREFSANQREIENSANTGTARAEAAIRYGHRVAAGAGLAILALAVGYLAIAGAP